MCGICRCIGCVCVGRVCVCGVCRMCVVLLFMLLYQSITICHSNWARLLYNAHLNGLYVQNCHTLS